MSLVDRSHRPLFPVSTLLRFIISLSSAGGVPYGSVALSPQRFIDQLRLPPQLPLPIASPASPSD
ncbi:hypothetical protein PGT21_009155 [Puccinia graminis f. sp. tritici]|uniref:Uncharacterized protein n=1 Tax=Puccinia graminis f. sp. tritici TaxID=56615 RepID=A0A5B0N240_PUCGR|nr:hypothetical protein PGT21_009155 [Puccinia graminis f. sp. tritici]